MGYVVLIFLLVLGLPCGALSATATLGTSTVLTTAESGHANLLVATRYTLPQSGTFDSINLYVATASGQGRVGVYADANGVPGALIVSTDAWTLVAGWNTRPIPTTTIQAGTYWLAWTLSSGTTVLRSQWGTGTTRYISRTFGALPSTWPSGSAQESVILSQYATVTTEPPVLPAVPVMYPIQFTGNVELSWDYSPGGGVPTEYVLEATVPPSTTWSPVATVPYTGTNSKWSMSSMTPGTKYCFRVYARNSAGSSPSSGQVCATMNLGTGLVCDPLTCRSTP